MRPLRILITNNTLQERAGSELVVRDLALGLVRKGHNPIAYSTVLGAVAEELEAATIPVVDDLAKVAEPPDIIHGQHHHEAMTAALHFPGSPAVFVCHGWIPWEERPPLFPSIRRYVAVDDLCRERLLMTEGIKPDQIATIYNFVDLERFLPRPPLPRMPRSVLVFSNYAQCIHEAIREECRSFGIERLDVIVSVRAARRPGQKKFCPNMTSCSQRDARRSKPSRLAARSSLQITPGRRGSSHPPTWTSFAASISACAHCRGRCLARSCDRPWQVMTRSIPGGLPPPCGRPPL